MIKVEMISNKQLYLILKSRLHLLKYFERLICILSNMYIGNIFTLLHEKLKHDM